MSDRKPLTDVTAIRQLIADHGRWWHEIEVAPGVLTPGDDSNRMKLPILDRLGLPRDLRGKRALDVGCSDGYFSFELERRGATVVAIDFVPENYSGFATARKILDSRVQYRMENVYRVNPDTFGYFDIVLLLGVLYHLRKPMAGLDAVRSVMKPGSDLFVGTMLIDDYFLLPDGTVTTLQAVNPLLSAVPLWQAYARDSLNGDFTNCFAPNQRALEVALEESQFEVEQFEIVSMGGYTRARAVEDPLIAKYQRLDGRLEKTDFDPSVPYFLDEEGSVHKVTGRRESSSVKSQPDSWWNRWRKRWRFDP